MRDNFDLLDIEDKPTQDLDIIANGEPILILQRTTTFVRAATGKAAQRVHDLDDFGLVEAGRIPEHGGGNQRATSTKQDSTYHRDQDVCSHSNSRATNTKN
ncbi:MAG: hypothetical protein M1813_002186 [Trichoglossum hirsutum]|nr:MAG: hypothetical protein M1813_002186 [Trichoglossum hirsutum]